MRARLGQHHIPSSAPVCWSGSGAGRASRSPAAGWLAGWLASDRQVRAQSGRDVRRVFCLALTSYPTCLFTGSSPVPPAHLGPACMVDDDSAWLITEFNGTCWYWRWYRVACARAQAAEDRKQDKQARPDQRKRKELGPASKEGQISGAGDGTLAST